VFVFALDCHILTVEDGLEKQFEEAAKGRDEEACRQAARASRANMLLPFVVCTPAAASRILYCNPVCFLSTMLLPPPPSPPTFNVMALSWMAPANSHGGFVFCIKKSRASFAAIVPGGSFGLSVATSAQAPLLLLAGGTSAREGAKLQRLPEITRCHFANKKAAAALAAAASAAAMSGKKRSLNAFAALAADSEEGEDSDEQQKQQQQPAEAAADPLFFISSSCAHISAQVLRVTDAADAGHALVVAQVSFPTAFQFQLFADACCRWFERRCTPRIGGKTARCSVCRLTAPILRRCRLWAARGLRR
jgi:flavin reductase (DIM6/NTAB) family NADH-FMN oxidoreductase RutF